MSDISENGVQNKVIKAYIDNAIRNVEIDVDSSLSNTSVNPVQNKILTEALNNKIDKVTNKQLSTEDFTSVLKTKLEGLSNYDDTEITNAISKLQIQLDTLVRGNASTAIESFNEIVAFLSGITDSEGLDAIIASIEQQIANKVDKIEGKGLSTEDYTTTDKTKLTGIEEGAQKNVQSDWDETDETSSAFIKNKPVIEVDDALSSTSENAVQNKVVTAALATKQDKIEDLDIIRSGAALGATSLQEHQDISHLATKEEVTNLENEVIDTEEVYAAAVNDLNTRLSNIDSALSAETEARGTLSSEFQAFKAEVVANEEVWATSLTDINDRIDANYEYCEATNATKVELQTEVEAINTTIVDNEEVIAATLTDLNSQIATLNTLITELTTRVEQLENA